MIITDSEKQEVILAYFKWHKNRGYVGHRIPEDVEEFIEEGLI